MLSFCFFLVCVTDAHPPFVSDAMFVAMDDVKCHEDDICIKPIKIILKQLSKPLIINKLQCKNIFGPRVYVVA